MSRTDTLKALEVVLESFLERTVSLKEDRLAVLEGINSLDDIAVGFTSGRDMTEQMGGWFAHHSRWLEEPVLRTSDQGRIGEILQSIKGELSGRLEPTPEREKIVREIDRWEESRKGRKLVLKRGPEKTTEPDTNTISLFVKTLEGVATMVTEVSEGKQHLLSVLDDALNSATLQQNREALLLSAFIIYYLKQNRYLVEPYVKRLKEAELLQQHGGGYHA